MVAIDGNNIVPMGTKMPLGGTGIEEAVNKNVILYTEDLAKSPFKDHQMISKSGLRSTINCPLITGGKAFGSLNVGSMEVSGFKKEDENLLFFISSHLSANLENRRLFAKNEKLLFNVLPKFIAKRLKTNNAEPIADFHDEVIVLFADIIGFPRV